MSLSSEGDWCETLRKGDAQGEITIQGMKIDTQTSHAPSSPLRPKLSEHRGLMNRGERN